MFIAHKFFAKKKIIDFINSIWLMQSEYRSLWHLLSNPLSPSRFNSFLTFGLPFSKLLIRIFRCILSMHNYTKLTSEKPNMTKNEHGKVKTKYASSSLIITSQREWIYTHAWSNSYKILVWDQNNVS